MIGGNFSFAISLDLFLKFTIYLSQYCRFFLLLLTYFFYYLQTFTGTYYSFFFTGLQKGELHSRLTFTLQGYFLRVLYFSLKVQLLFMKARDIWMDFKWYESRLRTNPWGGFLDGFPSSKGTFSGGGGGGLQKSLFSSGHYFSSSISLIFAIRIFFSNISLIKNLVICLAPISFPIIYLMELSPTIIPSVEMMRQCMISIFNLWLQTTLGNILLIILPTITDTTTSTVFILSFFPYSRLTNSLLYSYFIILSDRCIVCQSKQGQRCPNLAVMNWQKVFSISNPRLFWQVVKIQGQSQPKCLYQQWREGISLVRSKFRDYQSFSRFVSVGDSIGFFYQFIKSSMNYQNNKQSFYLFYFRFRDQTVGVSTTGSGSGSLSLLTPLSSSRFNRSRWALIISYSLGITSIFKGQCSTTVIILSIGRRTQSKIRSFSIPSLFILCLNTFLQYVQSGLSQYASDRVDFIIVSNSFGNPSHNFSMEVICLMFRTAFDLAYKFAPSGFSQGNPFRKQISISSIDSISSLLDTSTPL